MIKKIIAVGVVVFALIIFFTSAFIVTEGEYVCIRRFGKIIETKDTAGLYFKVPLLTTN